MKIKLFNSLFAKKDWQEFFNINPSRILVIDVNGQRTAAENSEKYDDKYNLGKDTQNFIESDFIKRASWTEQELGIKLEKVEIVPLKYGKDINAKTIKHMNMKNMKGYDFNMPWEPCNVLCRLSYKVIDSKNSQGNIIFFGIGSAYEVSLNAFVKEAGHKIIFNMGYGGRIRDAIRSEYKEYLKSKSRA